MPWRAGIRCRCGRWRMPDSRPCKPSRASRQAVSGRGSCWGGLRCAQTALRCSGRGRVAELATFASLTALKQLRRVCSRSALARADPGPALLFAPEIAPAGYRLPRGTGGGGRREQPPPAAKGCPGGARRACEAPSSTGFMARARSAPRDPTWRICLSAANEVSAASYAPGHGPEQRRAVGAPAETASVARRAPPGHPFAATGA
jgi:hypothetical protein